MLPSLLFCKHSTVRVRVGGWKRSQHFLSKAFDIILHSLPWLNAFTWCKFNFWQEKYISVSSPCVPTFVTEGSNEGMNNWCLGRKRIRTKLEKMKFIMDKEVKKWKIIRSLNQWSSSHFFYSFWLKISLALFSPFLIVVHLFAKHRTRKLKGNFIVVYIFLIKTVK